MSVYVILPGTGINSDNVPLAPADCGRLVGFLNSNQCGTSPTTGLSSFTCTMAPQSGTKDGFAVSMMEVCATGLQAATNAWQESLTDLCYGQVSTFLGYGDCDVIVESEDSCGMSDSWYNACQAGGVDFPHGCYPGNSIQNGGYGSSGEMLGATPWEIRDLTKVSATVVSFRVADNSAGCNPIVPKTGPPPPSCCQAGIEKMEIVIPNECYGQVQSMTVNGAPVATSYSNNSYITLPDSMPAGYPELAPWYTIYKVTKLAGISEVVLTLRSDGPCNNVDLFMPYGQLWYAYFNGNSLRNNCCGTSAVYFN